MAKNPITGLDEVKTNPNAGGVVASTGAGSTLPRTEVNPANAAPVPIEATPSPLVEAQSKAPEGVTVTNVAKTTPGVTPTAGLQTATGGYNPRTGGVEEVNKDMQVNTADYDAQKKVELAKSYGLTGSISQDAFFRDPTTGALSIKPEYITGASDAAAKVTTMPAQLPPDYTKPHSALAGQPGGDVWNAATGEWELPKVGENAETKALEGIYDANNLDSEERKWFNDNVFNSDAERKKFLSMTDQERLKYFTDIRDANRNTRDASLAAEQRKSAYDSQVEMQRTQFASQNAKMLDSIAADAQNMSMISGTAGRLQSRQMQTNIANQLKLNQDIYNNLLGYQDEYMKALRNEFEYANTRASNDYNDAMANIKKSLLEKIGTLQATGAMNTKSGLLQAQSFVDQATSGGAVAMSQYNYNLQVAGERVKAMADQMSKQNAYDDNITKQMGDGFLYTAQGTKMTDPQGNALKVTNTSGTLLTKEPIDMADGSKGFVYQNADGTTRVEKIVGTAPTIQMSPAQVENLAKGVSSGTIDSAMLKMLPTSVQAQVLAQINPAMATNKNIDFGKIGTDANGKDIMGFIDKETRKVTPLAGFSGTSGAGGVKLAPIANLANNTQMKQGQRGYWCGEFVNDALKGTGAAKFGDSLESKKALIDGNPPVVGSVVIMDIPGKYAENGHVGLVMGQDENGNLLIKSSNFDGTHKITTDAVSPADSRILGFYTPPVASQLSDDEQTLVGALKSYDLDPSKLPGGMSKEAQASKKRILAAAFGDPEFDMKKYPAKAALYKNWTSGKMSENNNGITTVTRHMMELQPALEALENGNLQKFNELWNEGATQFGVADPNNADVVANAVASEMAKVYKGAASPTTDEIAEWKSKISTNLSEKQGKGLIKTMSHLLYGKIASNAQNYTRTMGEKPENIFDAESSAFLKKYGVDVGKDFNTGTDSTTSEEPTPTTSALGSATNTPMKVGIGPSNGISGDGFGMGTISNFDASKYSLPAGTSGASIGVGNKTGYSKYFK